MRKWRQRMRRWGSRRRCRCGPQDTAPIVFWHDDRFWVYSVLSVHRNQRAATASGMLRQRILRAVTSRRFSSGKGVKPGLRNRTNPAHRVRGRRRAGRRSLRGHARAATRQQRHRPRPRCRCCQPGRSAKLILLRRSAMPCESKFCPAVGPLDRGPQPWNATSGTAAVYAQPQGDRQPGTD